MKQPFSRQVIQITVSAGDEAIDLLYALCDDGTIWWCECTTENKWERMNDVPQD